MRVQGNWYGAEHCGTRQETQNDYSLTPHWGNTIWPLGWVYGQRKTPPLRRLRPAKVLQPGGGAPGWEGPRTRRTGIPEA